jgi:hypothetical protein
MLFVFDILFDRLRKVWNIVSLTLSLCSRAFVPETTASFTILHHDGKYGLIMDLELLPPVDGNISTKTEM